MNRPTSKGILAILLWSSTIGFSRSISQELGPVTTGAVIYSLAGVLACGATAWKHKGLHSIWQLPRHYLWVCGGLFVGYIVCLYLAVGFAADAAQVLVVGLINYLWPAFTLLFAIPILGQRARWFLPVGIVLALAGVALAMGGPGITAQTLSANGVSYALMFTGAICWALYTNLSRRWLGESETSGVPLFLLCSGLSLGALRLGVTEIPQWSVPTAAQVIYMALGPAWLAYTFWDTGTRRGRMILLTALSYFTPLLSTIISIIVLHAPPSPNLWLAALLVMAGAFACQAGLSGRAR